MCDHIEILTYRIGRSFVKYVSQTFSESSGNVNKKSAAMRKIRSKIASVKTNFPDELRFRGRKHKVKRLPIIPTQEIRSIMVPMVISKVSINSDCNMFGDNFATDNVKKKIYVEELRKEGRITFASFVAPKDREYVMFA